MVEVVSTVLSQGAALGSSSQNVIAAARAAEPARSVTRNDAFVSGRIRVDNLQNVAILEYRSQEGDVVRQYPTQSQINAFRSAQSLQTKDEPVQDTGEASSAPAFTVEVSDSSAPAASTPAPPASAEGSQSIVV